MQGPDYLREEISLTLPRRIFLLVLTGGVMALSAFSIVAGKVATAIRKM